MVPWPLAPGGSGTGFRMAPSVAGSKGRLASGTVCGANARPGAAASRARVAGAGPRLRTALRCASACSHACQCVELIWRSGLPLHRRSWKACSQWYTVVGTVSWSSRSAGCAAAGHGPGFAAQALSFSRTVSRRTWCSPSRSGLDDHAGTVRHADHGFGPWQALGVADDDVRVRRAEHADHPLWVLLSLLGHRQGSRRAGVRDWPRVEVREVRDPDGVSLPRGP